MDGRVVLWHISMSKNSSKVVLEKYYEYTLNDEKAHDQNIHPRKQIQSLCIGIDHILAGCRSGDIYELEFPDEKELKSAEYNQNLVHLRMSCHDNEIPKASAFSSNNSRLYTITQKGMFCLWDLNNLNKLESKHFGRDTMNMVVCRSKPRIFIAFDNEIIVLKNEEGFPYDKNYNMKYKAAISDMKMSYNERILTVALAPNNEQNAKIEIYDADNEENSLKLLCSVDNLATSIEFLDFSTDNFYLLYKDHFEEVVIIDLTNLKKINTIYVEFDIEWCSDGIKVSDKIKGIQTFYSDENKFLKISKVGERSMIVTDEMGTVFLLFLYLRSDYSIILANQEQETDT